MFAGWPGTRGAGEREEASAGALTGVVVAGRDEVPRTERRGRVGGLEGWRAGEMRSHRWAEEVKVGLVRWFARWLVSLSRWLVDCTRLTRGEATARLRQAGPHHAGGTHVGTEAGAFALFQPLGRPRKRPYSLITSST